MNLKPSGPHCGCAVGYFSFWGLGVVVSVMISTLSVTETQAKRQTGSPFILEDVNLNAIN